MTDQARRDAYIRMGYEVDTASEARVKSSTDLFVENLRRMAAGSDAAAASAQKSAKTLAEAFDAQKNTVKATVNSETAELAKLRDQFDQTGAAAKKGLNVEGLRRTGGALSQLGLGEVGGAVSRVGDVGQIAKEANGLAEAMGPLGVTLPIVAGGIIGFEAGLKLVDAQLQRVSLTLNSALDTGKTYYDFLQTATSKEAKLKIESLKQTAYFQDLAVKETQGAIDRAVKAFNLGGLTKEEQEAIPGQVGKNFQKLYGTLESGQKALDDTNSLWGRLEGGLKSGAFLGNDFADVLNTKMKEGLKLVIDLSEKAAAAQAKLGAELRKAGDAEIDKIKAEQRVNNELTSFTYGQAQSRIKSIEDEKAINDKIILTRGLANSQLDRNSDEYKKNATEMAAATEANKNLNIELSVLKNAMNNLPAEIDAANQRVASVQKKYNDDRTAIETKSLEERAAIQGKYNDKLVELARSLADEAGASLRALEQQRTDLATGLGRDEAKSVREANDKLLTDRIAAARADEKAATDHYRRVADIQKAAQDREFDLIANRDFAGLFASRRQTTIDIQGENTSFSRTQQDNQKNLQQQQEDQARSFDIQRRERLIAYNQQLADAKLAYNRDIAEQRRKNAEELKIAAETRTKDLQALSSKTAAELRLKSQAYDAELRMAALYGQARINAEAATQKALLAQANARLSALTSGASGGTFMTQNTTTSNNRSVQVNANGYGANEVTNQIINVVRQIFK